jgi:hypothetical protein
LLICFSFAHCLPNKPNCLIIKKSVNAIKNSFLKIVLFHICNQFCYKSYAEKSLWISAHGMLELPHPRNALTKFVLSLSLLGCFRNKTNFFGGVVAQWIEHRTADARILGSNPGTSHQGWDYWQSPVTQLLGRQSKGLAGATASVTSAAAAPVSDSLQAGGLGGAGLWYLLAIWSFHL